jgi:ADP-ribosylglycohydrolase
MPTPPTRAERLAGGLIGLLVGDALGVPYEFHPRRDIPPPEDIEFQPPAGFRRAHEGVPVGTWSDDGAQALLLLNSLLERDRFDPAHFAAGLIDWYDNGYMAVGGHVFDIGVQTAKAIGALKRGMPPLEAGGADEQSNGNGSLMRVLPLALWHRGSDAALIADAFDQSVVTHGHVRAKLCCALYSLWARYILAEADDPWARALASLLASIPEGSPERIEFETRIFPPGATWDIKGSGYVVDSLRVALWANSLKTYEGIVKAAISLGDDTDTTACIAGGIAGLRLGAESIPARWRDRLRGREIYEPLLERLLERI